jgi:hypothetical protein
MEDVRVATGQQRQSQRHGTFYWGNEHYPAKVKTHNQVPKGAMKNVNRASMSVPRP